MFRRFVFADLPADDLAAVDIHHQVKTVEDSDNTRSPDAILKYARTTTTRTGLRVRARLIKRHYKKGIKITDAEMQALAIKKDDALPKWNYEIRPN